MKDLIQKVSLKLFKRRLLAYRAWKNYEIGFVGVGPTALDKKPDFPKPWLPGLLKDDIDADFEIEAKFRKESFRQACINIMGEDPDTDW